MKTTDNMEKVNTRFVGQEIKRCREIKGMTREELASRMRFPCTKEVLRQYEDGELDMDVEVFFDLTRTLCLTPNDLTPKGVMERSESGLGDYSRLNSRNKRVIDEMMTFFLKSQRHDIEN